MSKKGISSRFDFTPHEAFHTTNGEVGRNGHRYKIIYATPHRHRTTTYRYDFRRHPLREAIAHFLLDDIGEVTAATIRCRCNSLKLLGEFLTRTGARDLDPAVFKAFALWLFEARKADDRRKLASMSVVGVLGTVRALYRSGLDHGHPGWSERDSDALSRIAKGLTRGARRRSFDDSDDRALSLGTFTDLAEAVSREFEECKTVLAARNEGRRRSLFNLEERGLRVLDPNPFVVFALSAGLRYGLRSSEFNALRPGDIREDLAHGNHELYVHGLDKSDGYIPIDKALLAVLKVCEEWCKEARRLVGDMASPLLEDVLFVYPSPYGMPSHTCQLVKVTSHRLSQAHLPSFYKKWYDYKITDQDGNRRPLLHADGDPGRPLDCDFRKIRRTFAVRFAERERDRETAREALRHEQVETTGFAKKLLKNSCC